MAKNDLKILTELKQFEQKNIKNLEKAQKESEKKILSAQKEAEEKIKKAREDSEKLISEEVKEAEKKAKAESAASFTEYRQLEEKHKSYFSKNKSKAVDAVFEELLKG
ncbi:MAG: hypothetical protein ABIH20_01635 [Candidatus Diapherotrites archaeon]